MASYFNTVVIAEWLAFIAALILLNNRTGIWRLFIVLLFLILVTETTGWYLYSHKHYAYNALPFNIFLLVSLSFLAWFLGRYITSEVKRWLPLVIIAFILFGLANLLFGQGLWKYNSHTEAVGDIILALTCCFLLLQIIRNPVPESLYNVDYFWLTIGVLFSALGGAVLYTFQDLWQAYYLKTKVNISGSINIAINLILYASLVAAFFCRWKTTRSLSPL